MLTFRKYVPDVSQIGGASRLSATDESASRTHDAPDAAELGHVLAEDLAGLPVADVVVEGLSLIHI